MNDTKQDEWMKIGQELLSAIAKMAEAERCINETGDDITVIIKRFRSVLGLSQQAAAKIMGITPMYFSLLERGERPWTPKNLQRLIEPIINFNPNVTNPV